MKKNVPLLFCVRSKNNLPSLSTAHWGRVVKASVSRERERERVKVLQKIKQKEESRQKETIMMENGAQVEGQTE